jgi:hypothetical protein
MFVSALWYPNFVSQARMRHMEFRDAAHEAIRRREMKDVLLLRIHAQHLYRTRVFL